jgi:hypothetical protein
MLGFLLGAGIVGGTLILLISTPVPDCCCCLTPEGATSTDSFFGITIFLAAIFPFANPLSGRQRRDARGDDGLHDAQRISTRDLKETFQFVVSASSAVSCCGMEEGRAGAVPECPTIGDLSIKRRYWGCFTCRSLKNTNKSTHCPYCGSKRSQDRYSLQRDKILYLCRVHTEKIFPIVTILKIWNGKEISGKVKLRMIGDSLLDCMEAAIDDFESNKFLTVRQDSSDELSSIDCDPSLSQQSQSQSQPQSQQRPSEDLSLDLFHRVMKNGENFAYDGNIGQYVHVDTLTDSSNQNISRDLNYLKFMKREKKEMTKIVEETLQRRSEDYIEDVIDLTHDTLREWKGKVPCSLCEFLFPPSQLLGTISLNTLLNWRKDHQLSLENYPASKSSINNKYRTVRLCIFCTQFFDSNFSHHFDVEMEANAEIRTRLKEQLKQKKTQSKETPMTKLQTDLSIAELYHRKVGTIKQKTLQVRPFASLSLSLAPLCLSHLF